MRHVVSVVVIVVAVSLIATGHQCEGSAFIGGWAFGMFLIELLDL